MNHLAATTTNRTVINQVFNTDVGERTDPKQFTTLLKKHLSRFDPAIANVPILHGPERKGDIPHSLASIEKARTALGFEPQFKSEKGL